MATWFLPADFLGWIIIAGMAAMIIGAVLVTSPVARLCLTILAVLAMSWQIHHKGRMTERAAWLQQQQTEEKRQDAANREATLEAERDIAERKRELDKFEHELMEIQREVEAAKGAGDILLDRDDVDRLNRMRR